ncbi:MAG: PilC/PilY family type IV pilus protein [Pseudomonadota bacterium]
MPEQQSYNAIPRIALLAAAALACGLALAQKIDDIPPAVKNNVAPNFMFMIDNSGSMSNIVPAAPYSASATYLSSCSGTAKIPAGTSVDLNITSGAPRIVYGGTSYRHTTQTAGSGTQKCFDNAATYGARLLADTGTPKAPNGYLDSDYSGHYLNWYFGNYSGALTGWVDRKLVSSGAVETRIEIARTSAKSVVDSLPLPPSAGASAAVRVGLSTYTTGGGALRVAMGDFTTTTRTTIKTSIDGLDPSGNTPLASTFADIGRYISTGHNGTVTTANTASVNIETLLRLDGTDNTARNACLSGAPSCSSTSSVKPVQYWCQRTALFAMTDGRPQHDRSFNNNTYIRDYDRDCTGTNASTCVSSGATGSWDRKTARTYESEGSDYMDDIAKLLYDVDLRPDLTKPTPAAGATAAKNNIITYMIGFADPTVQNDPLLINTAEQGGGKFIAATDGPTLVDAFQQVIADALAKDAAAAAVAVTNAQITAGGVGYASSYNSGSWYGDLEAYSLDLSTGLRNGAVQWSFRDKLNVQSASTRRIASYSGTGGVPFTTANGVNFRTGAAGLTDGIINYTRGDRTGEDTTYRLRNYLLGDIINAEPVVVNYASGAVVYQAANDGMLHAIDGRIEAAATTRGQELWAYVPRLVHTKLVNRSSLTFDHEYIVDGTPATAAVTGVTFNSASVGRMLVGGLGKGGAGYYALDITSGTAANEAAAASKVMWEFKPTNMGYSFGTPLLVNTAAGWRVVVSSGLRNDTASGGLGGDGRGHVWVLNPANGAVLKEFVTPSGYGSTSASIGLAYLGKQANIAADAAVRYVYSGDLLGNVWRFDLDAATSSAPVRVAAVTSPTGVAQPITSAPTVNLVSGSSTKFWIYFGTGQYYSSDDVPGTSSPNTYATQVETLYGITDDTVLTSPAVLASIRGTNGATCPTGGGDGTLVCQSATASGTSFTATHNSVNLGSKRGFYMDIPITSGRVTTEGALSIRGTLVFVVNKPSNQTCNPGGTSYLFQLDSTSGGAVLQTTGGSTYYGVGDLLADALSSRPVLIITATGTRALLRLSDKTTQSRQINETASPPSTPGSPVTFKRVYKRALN